MDSADGLDNNWCVSCGIYVLATSYPGDALYCMSCASAATIAAATSSSSRYSSFPPGIYADSLEESNHSSARLHHPIPSSSSSSSSNVHEWAAKVSLDSPGIESFSHLEYRRPTLMRPRHSYASMCMSLPSASRSSPSIPSMSPEQSLSSSPVASPTTSTSQSLFGGAGRGGHGSLSSLASHVRSWVHHRPSTGATRTVSNPVAAAASHVIVHPRLRAATTATIDKKKPFLVSPEGTPSRPSSPLSMVASNRGMRQVSKAVF